MLSKHTFCALWLWKQGVKSQTHMKTFTVDNPYFVEGSYYQYKKIRQHVADG